MKVRDRSGLIATVVVVGPLLIAALLSLWWQSAHQPEVVIAAWQGDLPKVKALLLQGRSINERDKFGYTPLARAVYSGHTNMVHYLIAAGADLNITNDNGETAIMSAIPHGDDYVAMVEELIAAGADLNVKERHGADVLSYAESMPAKPRILAAVQAAMAEQAKKRQTNQ